MSSAQRLFTLFSGLVRAYGRYELNGKQKGLKMEGKATLVKSPLNHNCWEEHLAGKAGLGIVPINDDNQCRFGAIDIDVYDGMDLEEVAKRVLELNLPLVVCRSKSGGAHLYLFTSEPVPADLIRKKLMEAAVALGYAGSEIFPKQSSLANDKDFGNWINMPYFAGRVTNRYAIGPRGGQLSVDQFIELAEGQSLDVDGLRNLQPNADDSFPEGPPCLQALATRGFPEGSRNNALYDMAVYLRKRDGDAFDDTLLADYNNRFVHPSLPPTEVMSICKSVRKKGYEYKCKEAPICNACSREICLTRKHGIRGAKDDPGVNFGELIKIPTDPPIYIWSVNGERMELSSDQIMRQPLFQKACFERLDVWPDTIRNDTWQELVKSKLTQIEVVDAPDDASRSGRIWQLLEDFCTTRAIGRSRDELIAKKPWREGGWTYFRINDFLEYLQHNGMHAVPERQVWSILHKHNAVSGRWNIKGRTVTWWSVPDWAEITEPLDVPRTQEADI